MLGKVFLIALSLALVAGEAPPCTDDIRENLCKVPDCRCSGIDTPGKFPPEKTPQLVFLTFDDAVVETNYPFYKHELTHRKNPDGSPISATFFVTHEYTDYTYVHDLWLHGHDIALHSISHNPYEEYWATINETMWKQEITDQKSMMARYGSIPPADIRGMRSPHLKTGGDVMYRALVAGGFLWENSRPTKDFRKPGLWPYTNDYKSIQECRIEPCPSDQYKEFWTVPILDLLSFNGTECAMADACTPILNTTEQTFRFLKGNFEDHYNGSRAPFELAIHAGWVNGSGGPGSNEKIQARRRGYSQFLDYLESLPDVFVVSISRGLTWVQDPIPFPEVNNFTPFKPIERKDRCTRQYNCSYGSPPDQRYMRSCVPCPHRYPWVGNPFGQAQ